MKTITVEVFVLAPIETVWNFLTKPEHIEHWMHASDDWECTYAENVLKVDGRFLFRLASKDKSMSFDFTGTYTSVEKPCVLTYHIDDGRMVEVIFTETAEGVLVTETFEMEQENSEELQREGWQAMLTNFSLYVESSENTDILE